MAADLSHSRAEIEALVLRAARGAGVPLGWAEDVAHAIGFAATDVALDELAEAFKEPWNTSVADSEIMGSGLAPIIAACDAVLSGARGVTVPRSYPEMTAALVALQSAVSGRSILMDWRGQSIALSIGNGPVARADHRRFEPSADTLERLKGYAALTYVPETEASRLAGAGAGLTDND